MLKSCFHPDNIYKNSSVIYSFFLKKAIYFMLVLKFSVAVFVFS